MSPTRYFRRSLALLIVALAAASCTENPAGPELSLSRLHLAILSPSAIGSLTQATIGPAGGVFTIPGGHSISFPAGALDEPTLIYAVADSRVVKVDFGPRGLVFPDSALPTLTYSYASSPGITDANASSLRIVYLDRYGAISEVLPTTPDTYSDVVRAKIHHFSTYAMATD